MTWNPPASLEDQCFDAIYETGDCWDFSGVGIMEIVLKNLFPTLSQAAQNFFTSNNYCDLQGNFSLSRRYIAVLSGVKNNGNYQGNFWLDVGKWGMIPRSMLDFTPVMANDPNYQAFVTDFFNPQSVTTEMLNLGEAFNAFVTGSSIPVGNFAGLSTTPLQIGVPVPKDVSTWNKTLVVYDGTTVISHAVALLGINSDGSYTILDSYIPYVKMLSPNYLIGIITQPTITVNDVAEEEVPLNVFQMLMKLIKQIPNLFLWNSSN